MSEYTVSEGGHLYWSVRDAKTGRFVSRKVWAARNRAIASRARLAERRMAYALYLEARVSKAEEETRGHLLRDWTRGWSVARVIRENGSYNATQELSDWLEDNGPTLSYREFADQMADERAEAERFDRMAA
jgi:hypothetical protein